jgi:hypothetical protein
VCCCFVVAPPQDCPWRFGETLTFKAGLKVRLLLLLMVNGLKTKQMVVVVVVEGEVDVLLSIVSLFQNYALFFEIVC